MPGTERIGQDLGVILVAATVNQALKHFGRDGEISIVKIKLKNFVLDLNKLATAYKARFTANKYTTYFDKELLISVVKNCVPLGKFVSITSEEVIITATNFETDLKTAVATATLNYATLLVKYINDIDKIRSHVLEERAEAGLDKLENAEVKEVEIQSEAENDEAENEGEKDDNDEANEEVDDNEEKEAEKEDVEMEDVKENDPIDENMKELEEENEHADAEKTTQEIKQDVEVEKEESSSESESEEEDEEEDEDEEDEEDKAEADASKEEVVEVEKIEAPQLKSLDDNEVNDINIEEEEEEVSVAEDDDEVEEEDHQEDQKKMEVENKEQENYEETAVVEKDEQEAAEEKKEVEEQEKEEAEDDGEGDEDDDEDDEEGVEEDEEEEQEDDKEEIEQVEKEKVSEEDEEDVEEVDNVESQQVKQNLETSQESESEVISSREVSLEPKQEPPSRKRSRSPTATAQRKRFQNIAVNLIDSILAHRYSLPFLHPVSRRDAPEYYDVIKEPKDLKNILKAVKLKVEPPEYLLVKQLERDIMLMFANCVMYNKSDEDLVRLTRSMKNEVNNIFKMFEDAELEMK